MFAVTVIPVTPSLSLTMTAIIQRVVESQIQKLLDRMKAETTTAAATTTTTNTAGEFTT